MLQREALVLSFSDVLLLVPFIAKHLPPPTHPVGAPSS
jgi:hypothetical protein